MRANHFAHNRKLELGSFAHRLIISGGPWPCIICKYCPEQLFLTFMVTTKNLEIINSKSAIFGFFKRKTNINSDESQTIKCHGCIFSKKCNKIKTKLSVVRIRLQNQSYRFFSLDRKTVHCSYLIFSHTSPKLKSQILCSSWSVCSVCRVLCLTVIVQHRHFNLTAWTHTLIKWGFEPRDKPVPLCFWVMQCERPRQML